MEQELCVSALLELPLSSNRPWLLIALRYSAPAIAIPMALHTWAFGQQADVEAAWSGAAEPEQPTLDSWVHLDVGAAIR
jgi:hypothetical protein